MDYRSRQRYYERRRAQHIDRRRRTLVALGAGAVLLVVLLALLVRLVTRAPEQAAEGLPTAAVLRAPTAQPGQAIAPTADATLPTSMPLATPLPSVDPAKVAAIFDDQRFIYEPDLHVPQLQALLDAQPSPLKQMRFRVGDREHSFAEVLTGQTMYYSLNPKVLLALLELHNSLLSSAQPSQDQFDWAMNYRDDDRLRGLQAQIRFVVRQMLYARRDYPSYAPLTFADNSTAPAPPNLGLSEYMLAHALAPTTTPDRLTALMDAFRTTYTRLFGDPGEPLADPPPPAPPFLSRPMERTARVTSFFDHDAPFLGKNGSVFSYWGWAEETLSYDGHDGWDYALAPPDQALAAADGEVVFAGNADDNCSTRAVIIDHANGYRTLYWHLARVDVEIGQAVERGQPIGIIGESGCAYGPHLHFGVQYLGRATDPYGWCGGATPDPWEANPAGSTSVWLWDDRPSPCAAPPEQTIVVDAETSGFTTSGAGWQQARAGYGGGALFVSSVRGADAGQPWDLRPLAEPSVALYRPELPAPGRYRVLAYVPYLLNGMDDAQQVRYRIKHSDGESELIINQETYANDWIDLGTYTFAPDDQPLVALSNIVEENQRGVWADAVMWLPAEQ